MDYVPIFDAPVEIGHAPFKAEGSALDIAAGDFGAGVQHGIHDLPPQGFRSFAPNLAGFPYLLPTRAKEGGGHLEAVDFVLVLVELASSKSGQASTRFNPRPFNASRVRCSKR